jgi:beta-phosphoglucomutase-like phosphatase (HAD superfamily)
MATHAVEAVVFDLDGVLVDSEEQWDEVRHGLAIEAGRPWPTEVTGAMQGMSTGESSRYLTEVVGIPRRPRGGRGYRHRPHGGPLPLAVAPASGRHRGGAAAREPLAVGAGVVLAATADRRVLESADLTRWFPVSASTEEVEAGKPSPLVYQEVMRRLDVDPRRGVAIEDSSNGLRSAAEAGLKVIAVPDTAFAPTQDALVLADAVVGSLDEISLLLVESVVHRR